MQFKPCLSSQWSLVRRFVRDFVCISFVWLTSLSLRAKSYKTDAKKVSYKASYEAPLTRKTRLYTAAGFSEYFDVGDLLHTAMCYRSFRVMGYFYFSIREWPNKIMGMNIRFYSKIILEGNHALESEVHINSDRIEKGVRKEMLWWKQGYPANFTKIFLSECRFPKLHYAILV